MEQIRVETTTYSLSAHPPEPDDRRHGERHITLLRVGSLIIAGRRELCLIRNLSTRGMLIRAYCNITPGTRVEVELKCGQSVAGTARWAKDGSVGILLDEPLDIVALLAGSHTASRPRMPRIEVDCSATLRREAELHRVRTINISQGGIRVRSGAPLGIGDRVMISLPGLPPKAGSVRWRHDECFGVTFDQLVALPLLVGWLQEQQTRLCAAG